ncbi:Secretory lipase [Williamsia deligens]|nr:Secretory lipase [Williamsia deligens]
MQLSRVARVTTAAITLVVVAAACSPGTPPDGADGARSSSNSASSEVSSSLPAPVAVADRGSVVSQAPMRVDADGPLAGYDVTRIVYRSNAGYAPGDPDGDFGVRVSGIVVTPDGAPPAGGWPVVAVGHGTTGTDENCAPSLHPDLLGYATQIARLVRAGSVVTATDYVGLGEPGTPHPYLIARSAAYSMIDAVRAARRVVPDTSDRWAALGSSQGGQAAWAAAEWAGTDYGSGLRFVGAAALAPAADVAPIADGYDRTPFRAPTFTTLQLGLIPLVLDGLKTVDPGLDESQYIRGGLAAGGAALAACGEGSEFQKYSALTQVRPGDATVASPEALRALHDMLARSSLPRRRAAGPLFVAYGSRDQLVTPAWTAGAVRRACVMGDTVDVTVEAGRGHTDLQSGPEAVTWIGDRFAGRAAPSSC